MSGSVGAIAGCRWPGVWAISHSGRITDLLDGLDGFVMGLNSMLGKAGGYVATMSTMCACACMESLFVYMPKLVHCNPVCMRSTRIVCTLLFCICAGPANHRDPFQHR